MNLARINLHALDETDALALHVELVDHVTTALRRVAIVDQEAPASPSLRILGARIRRRFVGVLWFTTYEEVVGAGVLPAFRRRGIAKALWERAALELGVEPRALVAEPVTRAGLALARAMGAV